MSVLSSPNLPSLTAVTAMNKADILNVIKDAEEKAEKLKTSALQRKEKDLAKARNEALAKLNEGQARSKVLYDNMLKKSVEDISKEKEILRTRSNNQIEALRSQADANIDQAMNFLIQEFERKANGA